MHLSFDLGGTRLKAGIVSDAAVTARRVAVTDGLDADAALALIRTEGAALLDGGSATSVGLAVPGLVEDGQVVSLHGKLTGMVGVDLASVLAPLAPVVVVDNDARAYAVGEARFGAARGARRAVVVTIGTGVGVGVVEDGRPLGSGRTGGGTLGGMIPLDPLDPTTDSAGLPGTIEALCRAGALVDIARANGVAAERVEEVYAAHADGADGAARAIVEYRARLARALAVLALAHGPDVVVVGGGPFSAASPVLDGLEDLVTSRLWPGYHVRVVPAALGDDAALLGLAHLAAGRRPHAP